MKSEFAEIFIECDQDAIFCLRTRQYCFIAAAWHVRAYPCNVIPLLA